MSEIPEREDQKILPKFRSKKFDSCDEAPPRSYINLKELQLQVNEIQDPEIIDRFRTGLAVSDLTYLNMSHNSLGDQAVRWLSEAI